MDSIFQDIRYAFRMLAKSPGFTIVAVLTLALGIGANVATFSVVYAVLLRPLPFPHPEQLVRVFDDLRSSNVKNVGMSAPELWDLQDRSGVFQDLSAVWPIDSDIAGGDRYPVRKPDGGHLLRLIDGMGGDATRAVMIGDSENDAAAAQNAA